MNVPNICSSDNILNNSFNNNNNSSLYSISNNVREIEKSY